MVWMFTGGRVFADQAMFDRVMREIISEYGLPETIIHGAHPKGLDAMADEWGKRFGLEVVPFPAKWDDLSNPDAEIKVHKASGRKYDKRAGPRRNTEMVESGPDLCVAFPGSFGTIDCSFKAMKAGIATVIVTELGLITKVGTPPLT